MRIYCYLLRLGRKTWGQLPEHSFSRFITTQCQQFDNELS